MVSLSNIRSISLSGALALGCSGTTGVEDQHELPSRPLVDHDDPECKGSLTSFVGDCRALEAPAPDEGFQVRFGPDDYDDPDQLAEYTIDAGDELLDCVYRTAGNDEEMFYNRYAVSARPGMHHVIIYAKTDVVADGTHDDCKQRSGARLLSVLHGGIDGSHYEYPPPGEAIPLENEGLATALAAHETIVYEMHAVNATNEPLLRESWANIYAMPADEVREIAGQIAFNGGLNMNVKPHTKEVITNSCANIPGNEIRVVDFFGHMHSHATRFSAFVVRAGDGGEETRELVYESYDWSELDLIEFNSVVENPPVTYQGGENGGHSGVLTLRPGDRIEYECEIDNDEDYAMTYALGAFTAEMCNLFGSYAPSNGASWGCIGF